MSAPTFEVTDYDVAYLSAYGAPCSSHRRRYARFRQQLHTWLVGDRGNACQECGREFVFRYLAERYLVVHHVIPRYEGGPDTPDNLRLICGQCHTQQHADFELSERAAPVAPAWAFVARDEAEAMAGAFQRPDDPKQLSVALAGWRARVTS